MTRSDAPIVVLDSGLGGLTVVQALHKSMPYEKIVYFGDTARLPYGSKTAATVTLFVRQIIQYLLPIGPKHVVIACNTASALALPAIRECFSDLPITGVIEPGAQAAVLAVKQSAVPVVGVIGTEATIRSRAYINAILRLRPDARIICRATPLLVPIIEEGRGKADPLVHMALKQYLQPILDQEPSALVLGCTHYPILRPLIVEMVGRNVRVIDSADQCAQDVRERLLAGGLLQQEPLAEEPLPGLVSPVPELTGVNWLHCFVTDDSPRFATLAGRFLGVTVRLPELVSPDRLYNGLTVAGVA